MTNKINAEWKYVWLASLAVLAVLVFNDIISKNGLTLRLEHITVLLGSLLLIRTISLFRVVKQLRN